MQAIASHDQIEVFALWQQIRRTLFKAQAIGNSFFGRKRVGIGDVRALIVVSHEVRLWECLRKIQQSFASSAAYVGDFASGLQLAMNFWHRWNPG